MKQHFAYRFMVDGIFEELWNIAFTDRFNLLHSFRINADRLSRVRKFGNVAADETIKTREFIGGSDEAYYKVVVMKDGLRFISVSSARIEHSLPMINYNIARSIETIFLSDARAAFTHVEWASIRNSREINLHRLSSAGEEKASNENWASSMRR